MTRTKRLYLLIGICIITAMLLACGSCGFTSADFVEHDRDVCATSVAAGPPSAVPVRCR